MCVGLVMKAAEERRCWCYGLLRLNEGEDTVVDLSRGRFALAGCAMFRLVLPRAGEQMNTRRLPNPTCLLLPKPTNWSLRLFKGITVFTVDESQSKQCRIWHCSARAVMPRRIDPLANGPVAANCCLLRLLSYCAMACFHLFI